jgi:hypothetical protein
LAETAGGRGARVESPVLENNDKRYVANMPGNNYPTFILVWELPIF